MMVYFINLLSYNIQILWTVKLSVHEIAAIVHVYSWVNTLISSFDM